MVSTTKFCLFLSHFQPKNLGSLVDNQLNYETDYLLYLSASFKIQESTSSSICHFNFEVSIWKNLKKTFDLSPYIFWHPLYNQYCEASCCCYLLEYNINLCQDEGIHEFCWSCAYNSAIQWPFFFRHSGCNKTKIYHYHFPLLQ